MDTDTITVNDHVRIIGESDVLRVVSRTGNRLKVRDSDGDLGVVRTWQVEIVD